ncbi:ornithine carbamoyltransferase [Bradyrhizobium yuanmingense]|uniref:ornithine carbamoyltransferase n=1 Tax=Bradyrhizobium yuanmingense TaxID=108015 RepID=UPI0035130D54
MPDIQARSIGQLRSNQLLKDGASSMQQRNFLKIIRHSRSELEGLIELALDMKTAKAGHKLFPGKQLGLLFSSPSTRTRVSFHVAAKQLGMDAEYLGMDVLQMQNGESIKDTASVLGKYLHGLIVRSYDMTNFAQGQFDLEDLAFYANVPVINACDDTEHPCQIMADMLTLRELYGKDYHKKRIVFTWGYTSRQKTPAVTHSMIAAASTLGLNVVLTYPPGFDLSDQYQHLTNKEGSGRVEVSHDLMESCEKADVIYVRGWKSPKMSYDEDRKRRDEIRGDWCISKKHFERANPDAVFMDCMPLIREESTSADVVDGPNSIIYHQAANRLHMQKAILSYIFQASL